MDEQLTKALTSLARASTKLVQALTKLVDLVHEQEEKA